MKLGILFVLAACSGQKSTGHESTAGHAMPEHEMHHMTPELTSFHDVLMPRWHAAKGEQRMKDTCGAVAEFTSRAEAIAKAAPPAGMDGGKWSTSTKELGDAVSALGASCQANDAAAFELAFEKVHTTFHALMMDGGEHPEHKM